MLIRIYEKKPKRIRVSNAELKVRKSKAVKMRENGASVLEVAKELNVTKSKAKYYCRGCNSTYFKLENRFWRAAAITGFGQSVSDMAWAVNYAAVSLGDFGEAMRQFPFRLRPWQTYAILAVVLMSLVLLLTSMR